MGKTYSSISIDDSSLQLQTWDNSFYNAFIAPHSVSMTGDSLPKRMLHTECLENFCQFSMSTGDVHASASRLLISDSSCAMSAKMSEKAGYSPYII